MGRLFDAPLESFELLQDAQTTEGFHVASWLVAVPEPNGAGASADLYDVEYAKALVKTALHLLAGGRGEYAFAAGDEIVLVGRAAGEAPRQFVIDAATDASVQLSLLLGRPARFHARLFEFPRGHFAAGFLRWRQEQARSRALAHHCGRVLGPSAPASARVLGGMEDQDKEGLLRQHGFDPSAVPSWHWRGTAVYPSGASFSVNANLPEGDEYLAFVRERLG